MIYSMTGFGRSEVSDDKRKITVEIKSVNNRYLDLGIKMPRKFNVFDAQIRNTLKQFMKRGKTDVFITYDDFSKTDTGVKYNAGIAAEYYAHLKTIAKEFELPEEISASALSRYPEVLTTEEAPQDEDALWELLEKALCEAGKMFAVSREREGAFLQKDLLEKMDAMRRDVDLITERSPVIIEEYKKKLKEKVKDLLQDKQIEESRLLTEVTLFADKVAVDEELVRLNSHIEAVRTALETGDEKEGIGRRLDFLAQEMNREANTILSKSTDVTIADSAINLKTGIEKVREQIQNIE